jgi:hypothetical protein
MMAKFLFMLFNQLRQTAVFAYTKNGQAKQMLKLYCKTRHLPCSTIFPEYLGGLFL